MPYLFVRRGEAFIVEPPLRGTTAGHLLERPVGDQIRPSRGPVNPVRALIDDGAIRANQRGGRCGVPIDVASLAIRSGSAS